MRPAAALAASALVAACATADGPLPPSTTEGYLEAGALQAIVARMEAPPPSPTAWAGDPAVAPGSDRWWLATAHAEVRAPEAAQHFDCVLGARLTAKPRPALARLMNRLLVDTAGVSARLAQLHPRPRPVAVDRELEPCQRIDEATRVTPSWPAAGAVAGAVYGEMFAELAPDRAAAARFIGSELGRSRAVCRMNWPRDVEAGQAIGQQVWATAHDAADFHEELGAARAELAAARAEGLTSPACAAERRALGPMPAGGR